MKLIACSISETWRQALRAKVGQQISLVSSPDELPLQSGAIYLLHISAAGALTLNWLKRNGMNAGLKVAVCSDRPDVGEMLGCVRLGARAYCNSHMQAIHFQQMLRLLDSGQSWFPPDLLQKTFAIAQSALSGKDIDTLLADLTVREKEIAQAVAQGLSNREIARQMAISEPTVKTHLTRIFKKLDIKDRVALVLLLS